jgi:exopolyphosphatase/guanosine-5'-triphosphate,3'-diphosphate pyrophosphatase
MTRGLPVAAIACGTNSTRLLVMDASGVPIAREMRVTGLGRGVETTGRFATESIDDTVRILHEYRRAIEEHGADRVRFAATSAARDAANRELFFVAAEEAVGVPPELLSGEEEARLAFRSATVRLDPGPGSVLVVDLGGGSTEFAAGSSGDPPSEPRGVVSVDIGCVRLTERCLRGDPPSRGELDEAVSVVRRHLGSVSRSLPTAADATRMVLVGGTLMRVPAVTERLRPKRDGAHHSVLSLAAVEELFDTLARQQRRDRVSRPGLETALADVMLGGTLILATIMRYFGFPECLLSEADLLDGLALSLLPPSTERLGSPEPGGGPGQLPSDAGLESQHGHPRDVDVTRSSGRFGSAGPGSSFLLQDNHAAKESARWPFWPEGLALEPGRIGHRLIHQEAGRRGSGPSALSREVT